MRHNLGIGLCDVVTEDKIMTMREGLESVLRQTIADRSCCLSEESFQEKVGALRGAVAAFERIREICHMPSKGQSAYVHFQRDWDEIRRLVEPFCKTDAV